MNPPAQRRALGLVRPYVMTDGRARPDRGTFDVMTLVIAGHGTAKGLSPEKRRMMRLCQEGVLTVAEVAGHLQLPVTVVKILVGDLAASGHVVTRSTIPPAELPENHVLKEVLDGLRDRL